jgi:hypothetical protein
VPRLPHLVTGWPASLPAKRPARRVASLLLIAGLAAGAPTAFAAAPASAASICDPGADFCVVSDTVQTPLGPATITVTAGNVVTVQLNPTSPSTVVFGIPFAIPPGPPGLPGWTRTSVATAGGVVNIDTLPPGPPTRFALPGLAVVSIHPPSPCRVSTTGTTVVFTPIIPPGPPG